MLLSKNQVPVLLIPLLIGFSEGKYIKINITKNEKRNTIQAFLKAYNKKAYN